ncbi:hypothetical protein N6H14_19155 [Paenibacillus sp. CC-CFT747]|nr:hypothetical protein N6H14_19155 [Paenibacillus sp. CC-CFT747]
MAEGIVVLLEIVQVENRYAKGHIRGFGTGKLLLEQLLKITMVVKPGPLVLGRLVRHLLVQNEELLEGRRQKHADAQEQEEAEIEVRLEHDRQHKR